MKLPEAAIKYCNINIIINNYSYRLLPDKVRRILMASEPVNINLEIFFLLFCNYQTFYTLLGNFLDFGKF